VLGFGYASAECSVYRVKCPTLWLKINEYGALVLLS